MESHTILVADDDASIRTVLGQALARAGYEPRTTASAAGLWNLVAEGEGALVVTDVVLPDENGFDLIPRIRRLRPGLPIVVMSAQNTILTAIAAAEHGAFEYLPKPFDLKELITTVERALAAPRVPHASEADIEKLPLIGRSPPMQEVYRAVARLTKSDLTVTITGESGTGKELVARVLHDYGLRRRAPFVAVNVAAMPKDLIESELFGHERGAFTGAVQRGVGRFEQADSGTLFLDEIGDMPLEAQTRLLRVLQEGEYTSVGGRALLRANVRIIAATNRDLSRLVREGLFREDLYYRLNVVPLRVPPLRERTSDIADLVRHFLAKGGEAKSIEIEAIALLEKQRWPGNVRELENLVRRLGILHSGDMISVGDVSRELAAAPSGDESGSLEEAVARHLARAFVAGAVPPPGLYARVLAEMERPLLAHCLEATGGNQIRAAGLLGLNRNTLRKKLREHGIEPARGVK
ncbi:MAG TPA: nitrogen regulation protein NR(I) [Rhizomicrobium sp.]|jgi:two-component system nitrogen regulation response regulator GlnG